MKTKKTLNTIKNIFVWTILILAIAMMVFTIVSVRTFDRNDRSLFGYKAFIVKSDSMSATDFAAGDLVLIKEVDPALLAEGDIISFISKNKESYGETITHKIRSLTRDDKGERGFITYGTTTDTDDDRVVTYPYVLGKYAKNIPNLGKFFTFLKTTPGYILCVLIPFLLLIGFSGFNSIQLFRRYKAEQLDELQLERDQLAEERKKSEEMMKELQALKEQLTQERRDDANKQAENNDKTI